MVNLVHPEIPGIPDVKLGTEPFYRTRRSHGKLALRGAIINSSALTDSLKGEESIPAGEGEKGKGEHEEICFPR